MQLPDLHRLRHGQPLAELIALTVAIAALGLACRVLAGGSGHLAAAEHLLLPGLLLVAGAFAGRLAGRFGLPRLTGYILMGAVLGPQFWMVLHGVDAAGLGDRFHFFDAAQVSQIKIVNDLAIGLIALMAGAEIRMSWLRQRLRSVLAVVGAKVLLVPLVVGAGVWFAAGSFPFMAEAAATGRPLPAIALLAGIVALASSPMVVVSVIKETGSNGPLSETAMGVAVLKDVGVIFGFTLLVALLSGEGASTGFLVAAGGRTLMHIAMSIVLGLPLGWALAIITERGDRRSAWLVVGFALLVALLEPLLHVKPLFCLLSAGFACENLWRGRTEGGNHRLERALDQVAAPVFIMFFVAAGLGLKLTALISAWVAVLILVLLRAAVVWVAVALGTRLVACDPVVRRHLWAAMIPQAGVTLGLAIIVQQQFPGWGDTFAGIIVACVAIHEIVGPIIFTSALRRAGEACDGASSSSSGIHRRVPLVGTAEVHLATRRE